MKDFAILSFNFLFSVILQKLLLYYYISMGHITFFNNEFLYLIIRIYMKTVIKESHLILINNENTF